MSNAICTNQTNVKKVEDLGIEMYSFIEKIMTELAKFDEDTLNSVGISRSQKGGASNNGSEEIIVMSSLPKRIVIRKRPYWYADGYIFSIELDTGRNPNIRREKNVYRRFSVDIYQIKQCDQTFLGVEFGDDGSRPSYRSYYVFFC